MQISMLTEDLLYIFALLVCVSAYDLNMKKRLQRKMKECDVAQ